MLKVNTIVAKCANCRHVMANEQNRTSLALAYIAHLAEAFALKLGIAHCQYFINNKYLRLQISGYCKCQAYIHAAAVAFNRGIYVALNARKIYYFVKLAF